MTVRPHDDDNKAKPQNSLNNTPIKEAEEAGNARKATDSENDHQQSHPEKASKFVFSRPRLRKVSEAS